MRIENLTSDMNQALKNGDKLKRVVLQDIVASIQQASVTNKGRTEINEEFVNNCLIKYQKTIQEMIDTCPVDRVETKKELIEKKKIVDEYAPQLITDKIKIENMIMEILSSQNITLLKSNKGKIMRSIMPAFKGKADMKIVNEVITKILK